MGKVFTVPPKPVARPEEKAPSHTHERVGILKERRWGTLRVASVPFDGPQYPDSYLPEDHKIIATRHQHGSIYLEHIVSGPDMPLHESGNDPAQVFLIFDRGESGLYCWWEHLSHKRWPVPS